MKPIIIIPARMAAVRLPGKPLADIVGQPMIIRVLRLAEQAGVGPVYVACAEKEIADAVEKVGGKAILTNPDHPSGTDRIFEALGKADPTKKHDLVINIQGDLPNLDPASIKKALIPFSDKDVDIATPVAVITDVSEKTNPNVVKAIVAWNKNGLQGRALYFTRATAPANDGPLYHHIGLYVYRRPALERFVSLPQSILEKREKLEQLRALEANMRIDAVLVDSIPISIDTPEDLEKARKLLRE